MILSEKEWIDLFARKGIFWCHDGDPKRPHALLTKGGHSNGYFNGTLVSQDPALCQAAVSDICEKLEVLAGGRLVGRNKLFVIGPALGACMLSYAFGLALRCQCGFAEPVIENGKTTAMLLRRPVLEAEQYRPLVVEDVITTGASTRLVIEELERRSLPVFPAIVALCNRSGKDDLDGLPIVALVNKDMPIWKPEECPICKQGSEAIRPKGNWDRLTQSY